MRDWHLMARHLSARGMDPNGTGWATRGPGADHSLANEIAREKAATLGRFGRQLEVALAELENFDRNRPPPDHSDLAERGERRRLVAEAACALWYLVVQREACGLWNTAQVMRDYRVPEEVRLRMGAQDALTPAADSRRHGL